MNALLTQLRKAGYLNLISIILLFAPYFGMAQNGVGINTSTPKSDFEVNGSFGQKVTAITGTTTLDATYNTVVCNNDAAAITINLPAISTCLGRVYVIKRGSSTANVTLDANASETIDGSTTLVLSDSKGSVAIFNDGTEWKVTNHSASSSAWSASGNANTDSSTNYLGTSNAQALVIKTNNTERVHITKDGSTIIGGSTNHTKFEPDGTIVMEGDATVWDDLMVFPDATTKSGSYSPTMTKFTDNGSSSQGVLLNAFSASTEQELYFTVQVPHKYKLGTNLYPHVHWTTFSGTPSGTNVVWGLEYTVVQIGETFGNTTILTSNSIIGAIGTPSSSMQHLITSFASIDGTNFNISTVIICRLFRATADASDTFSNSVGLLGIDFHYEIDTEGSRSQFEK